MRKGFILMIMLLTGCNTAPVIVKPTSMDVPVVHIAKHQKILIIVPSVTAKNVYSGGPSTPNQFKMDGYAGLMASLAKKGLKEKGFVVATQEDVRNSQDNPMEAVLRELTEFTPILASPYKENAGALPLLKQLEGGMGIDLVCAMSLVVKEGKPPGYNPMSGEMWQGATSSAFRAALISTSSGQAVWNNEVYVRKPPDDQVITKSMELLFKSLTIEK